MHSMLTCCWPLLWGLFGCLPAAVGWGGALPHGVRERKAEGLPRVVCVAHRAGYAATLRLLRGYACCAPLHAPATPLHCVLLRRGRGGTHAAHALVPRVPSSLPCCTRTWSRYAPSLRSLPAVVHPQGVRMLRMHLLHSSRTAVATLLAYHPLSAHRGGRGPACLGVRYRDGVPPRHAIPAGNHMLKHVVGTQRHAEHAAVYPVVLSKLYSLALLGALAPGHHPLG